MAISTCYLYFLLVFLTFQLRGSKGYLMEIDKELGTNKSIDVISDPKYSLLPFVEKCGFSSSSKRSKRIVGGRPSPYSDFPWMAQLYLTNVTSQESYLFCGGTFITNQVILTAAHCLSRIATGTSLITVGFGQSDRTQVKLCKVVTDAQKNKTCSKRLTRTVKRTIIHEGYSEGNIGNDIGLIILDRPVRFSSRVRPICLPYSEELLRGWTDKKLKILGWGVTSKMNEPPRITSATLLNVDIHVQERHKCSHFHTRQYGKVTGSRFCAGGDAGRGSCNGDSGGPLIKNLPVPYLNGEERWFQFGLVSSGSPKMCGYPGFPNLYTNVIYFVPWILEQLALLDLTMSSEEDFSISIESFSEETARKEYLNELFTGLNIDVSGHKNIHKLPNSENCGNVFKNDLKGKEDDDFDTNVDIVYDKETEKESESSEETEESSEESKEKVNSTAAKLQTESDRRKRMVGGRVPGIGWFPFLAQIYYENVLTGELEIGCGGTIISPTVILTAASCVTELPASKALESIHVGNYNRNKTEECVNSEECFEPQVYAIKQIIVHKDYEMYTYQNDIALIKIAGKIKFDYVVQPICLPTKETIIQELPDNTMISMGWGLVEKLGEKESNEGEEKNASSSIPKYFEVKLEARDRCEKIYKRNIAELGRERLCGIADPGNGECDGDSGGPLLKPLKFKTTGENKVKKFIQFGIISLYECGSQGMSSVYTNILSHMPWILDNL